jgi:hypothetical protein
VIKISVWRPSSDRHAAEKGTVVARYKPTNHQTALCLQPQRSAVIYSFISSDSDSLPHMVLHQSYISVPLFSTSPTASLRLGDSLTVWMGARK